MWRKQIRPLFACSYQHEIPAKNFTATSIYLPDPIPKNRNHAAGIKKQCSHHQLEYSPTQQVGKLKDMVFLLLFFLSFLFFLIFSFFVFGLVWARGREATFAKADHTNGAVLWSIRDRTG